MMVRIIKRENYDKIEEAATPYLPPLDMSSIPDEDDEDFNMNVDEDCKREEANINFESPSFQENLSSRLLELATTRKCSELDESLDRSSSDDRGEDAELVRSNDYRDGMAFENKRQNHYDMKNALKLGKQMIEEEEEDEIEVVNRNFDEDTY